MSLHVFMTVEQLEQMLRQKARAHGVAHAQDCLLFSRLLEQCIPLERRRLCCAQEQVLIAWDIVRRHPRDSTQSESPFHVAQLFVEQLKSIRLQGCLLEEWRQLAFKLKAHAQLVWFAAVWEEYVAALSARFLMDEVDMLYAATDALCQGNLPPLLCCAPSVYVHNLVQTTPAQQRFFFALDKALSSAGGELLLETHGVDNPALDGLVDELHAEFEQAEEGLDANLSLVRNVLSPDSPAFELCKHVLCETHSTAEALPWDCFVAPNACREARETARRIAHLLKQGVAPEAIAVVLCSEETWAHALWHELSSHSIVAHIQEEVPLSSCALGKAILRWPKWAQEGFPVEEAHLFFSNPLFEKTFVSHDDVGIWLQRAGIGPHSKQESLDEYAVRLNLLQKSGQLDDAQRHWVETLQQRIEVAKHAARQIPEEGSFEDMLDSWLSSLQEMGFHLSASMQGQLQASLEFSSNLFEKQIYRKTLARENAAGVFFKQALGEWKLKLQKTGAGLQRLTRREFSEWVWAHFGNEAVRLREPQTAGVTIAHVKAMRSQKYKHVFFFGMKDGAFSQKKKNALIPEALQSVVNANSPRPFFRIQRGESLHKLPEDIVLERRHFAEAVCCATQTLCFSYALAEQGGREVAPSVFWQEALRVLGKPMPTFAQASRFSKHPDACMTESDFRGHVAQKMRRNLHKKAQAAPQAPMSLQKENWFLALSEKSEAERERFYFQRDRTKKAGPYTGSAWGPKTEKHLKAFTQLPWSAYAFGRLGGCAFWFFMAQVLKGEVFEDFSIDAGAKTKGILFHGVLALLGGDLAVFCKTMEGLSEAQQRKKAAKAVKAAQEKLSSQGCLLNPELWALCCEQVAEELLGLLNSKSLFPWGPPQKTCPEWSFEEELLLSNLDALGEEEGASEKRVLKLKGRLDRLDFLGKAVGIVDYKLSKRGGKNKYRESLLLDDFQLLLYLFVLRKKGFQAHQASWVFLREKAHFLLEECLTQEELDEVLEEDTAARLLLKKEGKPNLLNRMEELISKVERGDFAPTPVDCSHCPFKRACRISETTTLQADNP